MIAALDDLIFSTRITATAQALGRHVLVVRDDVEFAAALGAHDTPVVIIDLNSLGTQALDAVRLAAQHLPRPQIVAYGAHVDVDLLREAGVAGADIVVPRSRLFVTLERMFRPDGGAPPAS